MSAKVEHEVLEDREDVDVALFFPPPSPFSLASLANFRLRLRLSSANLPTKKKGSNGKFDRHYTLDEQIIEIGRAHV